jgi:hypothetical protein
MRKNGQLHENRPWSSARNANVCSPCRILLTAAIEQSALAISADREIAFDHVRGVYEPRAEGSRRAASCGFPFIRDTAVCSVLAEAL